MAIMKVKAQPLRFPGAQSLHCPKRYQRDVTPPRQKRREVLHNVKLPCFQANITCTDLTERNEPPAELPVNTGLNNVDNVVQDTSCDFGKVKTVNLLVPQIEVVRAETNIDETPSACCAPRPVSHTSEENEDQDESFKLCKDQTEQDVDYVEYACPPESSDVAETTPHESFERMTALRIVWPCDMQNRLNNCGSTAVDSLDDSF